MLLDIIKLKRLEWVLHFLIKKSMIFKVVVITLYLTCVSCLTLAPCLTRRRSVRRKRLIYAPLSGVGGIVYDKDAVYIDLGGSHSHTQTSEVIINH